VNGKDFPYYNVKMEIWGRLVQLCGFIPGTVTNIQKWYQNKSVRHKHCQPKKQPRPYQCDKFDLV